MPGLNSETDALHESLFLKEIRWDKEDSIHYSLTEEL